jgi:hypothetical protein
MYHDGYLVVRRVDWFTEFSRADRLPAVNLSHKEILECYRGVDGEPSPEIPNVEVPLLQAGLAPGDKFSAVEAFYYAASNQYLCDLLYVQLVPASTFVRASPLELAFLGYDYGYYLSESNLYSSLFHEIIYGLYPQMRTLATVLNNHLLLPSMDVVELVHRTRSQLIKTGADLERDETSIPIAIYGASREPRS